MTNAVILSAGQGKRLKPFTDDRPKCLVPVNGRPVLDWQLSALADAGVTHATVITGFGAGSVEAFTNINAAPLSVECVYNPFYAVSDNIGTLWIARNYLTGNSLLINGDTLIDPRIIRKVIAEATAPVTVTIDHKEQYDSDDMKVRCNGTDLSAIGKTLEAPVDGESIGLIRLQKDGADILRQTLDNVLRTPDGLRLWYLSVIDTLAKQNRVGTVSITGLPWAEIDFPADLTKASKIIQQFRWNNTLRSLTKHDIAQERQHD